MKTTSTSNFATTANAALVAWKHHTPTLAGLDLAPAPYSKKPNGPVYDVCLPLDHADRNLLPDARAIALDRFTRLGIRWHDEWQSGPSNHLRDSQVQCVNALAPLVARPDALAQLFAAVLPIDTVLPFGDPGAPEDHVVFEWVGLTNHLNEWNGPFPIRGAHMTSTDAAIRYRATDDATEIALVEWKYTESYLRAYAAPSPATTAKRLKRYEPLWANVVRTDLVALDDLFVEPIYQMLRQQMLAHEMERVRELGAARVRVVYCAPAANTALWSSLPTEPLRNLGSDVREVWEALRLETDRFVWFDTAALVEAPSLMSGEFVDRYGHLAHRPAGSREL